MKKQARIGTLLLFLLSAAGCRNTCPADSCRPSPWAGCELRTWGRFTYLQRVQSKNLSPANAGFGFDYLMPEGLEHGNMVVLAIGKQRVTARVDPVSCRIVEIR
jgi:hypothetical protein